MDIPLPLSIAGKVHGWTAGKSTDEYKIIAQRQALSVLDPVLKVEFHEGHHVPPAGGPFR